MRLINPVALLGSSLESFISTAKRHLTNFPIPGSGVRLATDLFQRQGSSEKPEAIT